MASLPAHRVNHSRSLEGKSILVTRPTGQSRQLIDLIEANGGKAVFFPVLEIQEPTDTAALHRLFEQLDTYDMAIFISPTAVERCLEKMLAWREWPSGIFVAAVGQGTAQALEAKGINRVITPSGQADSESLLDLTKMKHVSGMRILIFRGQGGREHLADTLQQRGAEVTYAECYRRAKPQTSVDPLLAALKQADLAGITVTSSEGLDNLFEMAGPENRGKIASIPCFVIHERIAATARKHGIHTIITTTGGDAGLLKGMVKFFQS